MSLETTPIGGNGGRGRKTLFIFPRLGESHRNLLRTDVLETLLRASGLRIVVISPLGHEPYFRDEFSSRGVIVEPLPKTRVGFLERRLKHLKFNLWSEREPTSTIKIKRQTESGSWALFWRDAQARLMRRAGITEGQIGKWEISRFRSPKIGLLYDRYRPDAVLFTKLFSTNIHMVKEAKKRGIRTICAVEAWDNLSSKGPLSVIPDSMIVWSDVMKSEAVEFHGFPAERIHVAGIPQFDIYHDPGRLLPREEFFKRHGLDPELKLITYAAAAGEIAPREPEIVEELYRAVIAGRIGLPSQILVRLHPQTRGKRLDAYRRFDGRPRILVQSAGRIAKIQDGWDPSWEDMIRLSETMMHSDVVINVGSTISLDAIAFDTPVIGVGFEADGEKPYLESYRRYYDYTHMNRIVSSGGLRIARSLEELLAAVNGYLRTPSLDAEGRARVRREQCYRLDGQSGKRAAQAILMEMQLASGPAPESSISQQTGLLQNASSAKVV